MTTRLPHVALAALCLPAFARAQDELQITPLEVSGEPQRIALPYAFFNDSFGAAAAYVYSITGFPQRQASLLGTAMAGSNGSGMLFLMARDVQLPWAERVFTDTVLSYGHFEDNIAYIDGNPAFAGERAGSHDSDADNYVEGSGDDGFARLRLRYLLPIGHGAHTVVPSYRLDRGLLVSGASGGDSLNPLESGRTFVELRPFYRSLEIEGDGVDTVLRTNGVDLSLFWDNRDFPLNPARGHGARVRFSRDFGSFDSSTSWSVWEGELDKYVSLGATDTFRARVLAFDVWTSYSPTWEEEADGTISNRPPAYTGPTLGGLFRMRGYPAQRFSDKAALLYSAELRLTPEWNPFPRWTSLQDRVAVQWLQLAAFVEFGRVAPEWELDTLHEDMNWSVGAGLRFFAKGLVLRLDLGVTDEGSRVQMMVGNPFQF